MNRGRVSIKVCHECKPVFNADGTRDMNYRSPGCHDRCDRYKAQVTQVREQKKQLKAPEHADYLRSRKLVKGQI